MPVQELERPSPSTADSSLKDLKKYEVLIQPGPGGSYEPNLSLNDTIVEARPNSRNLPATEPQEMQNIGLPTVFPSSGSISFKEDFEHINQLHTAFGLEEGQRLSHDPVLERARYERAATTEEKKAVKQGVIADMEKTLYERARASQSTVVYYQDAEGRIYNPGFPGESFDKVLQRGLEYSKSQGYVDYERELEEYEGWKEVMAFLFDRRIPQKSKAVVISGPGFKKGTAFTDNFVDIYTKTIHPATGKVIVVMTRFVTETNYSESKKVTSRLDSQNYNSEKTLTDEEAELYFIRHPIFIDSTDSRDARQIFEAEFKKQKGATEEDKTKHYLEECRLLILHYAETICLEFFDPEEVKLAFNAVLNKFDSLRKGLIQTIDNAIQKVGEFGRSGINRISSLINKTAGYFKSLKEEIDHYGRMKVEERMVGCGPSVGFSLGGRIKSFILGGLISVGTSLGILESDSMGSLYFACPACGTVNKRPREGYIKSCQNPNCPNPQAVRC